MGSSFFSQISTASGVASAVGDTVRGPLEDELVEGANITLTTFDPGSGNDKIRIAASATAAYESVVDPKSVNDDVDTEGIGRAFEASDHWVNTALKKLWACTDATTSTAVWVQVGATSGGSAQSANTTLVFSGASSVIAAGVTGRPTKVLVNVSEAWDGVNGNASLTIGDDSLVTRLMAAGDVDLYTVGIYVIDCYYEYISTAIEYYYSDDTATSSAGACDIELLYST